MTSLRIITGMKYGFKLLGIFIAVSLVCGAFIAGGTVIYRMTVGTALPETEYYGRIAAGILMTLVGGLGLTGAVIGLLHKFIADSVVAGIETAEPAAVTGTTAGPSPAGATSQAVAESSTDSTADETEEPAEETTEQSSSTEPEPEGAAVEETPDSTAAADTDSTEEETEAQEPSANSEASTSDADPTDAVEGGAPADRGEDDGIFGIDTSEAKAEMSEPRTRDAPPAESTAATGGDEPDAAGREGEMSDAAEPDRGVTNRDVDPAGQRPTSPDQRTWEREDVDHPPTDGTTGGEEEPGEDDHGYPENLAANPPREDDEDAPEDHIGVSSTPPSHTETVADEAAEPDDAGQLWDDETDDGGNIDEVVSDATKPESADGTVDSPDDDPAGNEDSGTLMAGAEEEPQTIDDAPGEFVAKPPADDSTDEDVGAAEPDAPADEPTPDGDGEDDDPDPVDKLPDEPITDDDIEDTTDSEGDWEPLDESDL